MNLPLCDSEPRGNTLHRRSFIGDLAALATSAPIIAGLDVGFSLWYLHAHKGSPQIRD